MRKAISIICAATAMLAAMPKAISQQVPPAAFNQSPTIKRTTLQRFEVPGAPYETVIGIAEIAPNVSIGRHTHPGPESGYIIEGGFVLLIDGEPPRQLKAGDSYQVPPMRVHDARTEGSGAKVIATYVVEKGKLLATPAN